MIRDFVLDTLSHRIARWRRDATTRPTPEPALPSPLEVAKVVGWHKILLLPPAGVWPGLLAGDQGDTSAGGRR